MAQSKDLNQCAADDPNDFQNHLLVTSCIPIQQIPGSITYALRLPLSKELK